MLRKLHGWDNISDLVQVFDGLNVVTIVGAPNARNGSALSFAGSGGSWSYFNVPNAVSATTGFAVKVPDVANRASQFLFAVGDGVSYQLVLLNTASGALEVRRGSRTGPLLASSADGLLLPSVYTHIQFGWVIDAVAGSVEVRLHGAKTPVLIAAGVNTQATANPFGRQIGFGNGGSSWYLDDFYYCDDVAGDGWVGFQGDVRVRTLRVNRAGDANAFAPTGAPTNWETCDEVVPDGDITFCASAVVGAKQLFGFGESPADLGEVRAVKLTNWWRKDDAGTRQVRSLLKIGVTEVASAVAEIADTYTAKLACSSVVVTKHPVSGAALTKADVDSIQGGGEVAG